MTTEIHRQGWRTWVVVVVAVVSMTIGFFLASTFAPAGLVRRGSQGWLRTLFSDRPPVVSERTVLDFLDQPLPVPEGATELTVGDHPNNHQTKFGCGGVQAGDGTVVWSKWIALDVMGMSPEDIQEIPNAYYHHLTQIPLELTLMMGIHSHPDLAKVRENRFCVGAGDVYWTWCRHVYGRGPDFDIDVDAEVMDFEQILPPHSSYRRQPVKNLTDPVRGQRIMWVRIDFTARNLVASGEK